MKPTHLIPPSRRVPVKREAKPLHSKLGDATEAYYQSFIRKGYSSQEAATSVVAFVKAYLVDRLP